MNQKTIKRGLKTLINKVLNILDLNNTIVIKEKINIADMETEFFEIKMNYQEFTMTSMERQYALYQSIKYIVKNKIEGDIVECGVWKGGSMMLCALTLLNLNDTIRKLYLYDTYGGLGDFTERDVRYYDNKSVMDITKEFKIHYPSMNEVKKNLYSTNYPKDNLLFIKGKVEKTIPTIMPKIMN